MRKRLVAWLTWALVSAAASTLSIASNPSNGWAQELRFLREGRIAKTVALPGLIGSCGSEVVRVAEDPYYERAKRFYALPLRCVLRLGFERLPAPGANVILRAADGYARPASGAQLTQAGGWVAFGDADVAPGDPRTRAFEPGWERIDRRQLEPGPFYLVWSGSDQADPHRHPWPYQLVEVELTSLDRLYPHIVPGGAPPDSAARRGYALFRDQCLSCHAINGEGGAVGPDLNVPRSIVEYRPAEQIKAFVRDPGSFRYTTMPPNPGLSDADLDDLLAYFRAMSERKHDPRRREAEGTAP